MISLEDYKLEPGDVVSLYATAKDARTKQNTDIYFIETQPFEKNYSQSQQAGGGGGGGGDDEQQNAISARQKEIIAATWNQIKGNGAKGTDAENATFLASVQSKLRDQAKSLADRMKARQLTEAGDSFKSFTKDMEQAVEAMGPATDKLKISKWQDALPSEQKALQYLLRAEATFRDIQVAFGNQGGGGGGAAVERATWKGCSIWSWTPRRTSTRAPSHPAAEAAASSNSRSMRCNRSCSSWPSASRSLQNSRRRVSSRRPSSGGSRKCCVAKRSSCGSRWSRCSATRSKAS